MLIRPLDMQSDLDSVAQFLDVTSDYWELAEGRIPGPEKAKEFFQEVPPNCNADETHRLGLFIGERLTGLADLSFGFPDAGDAYLGLMILGPWARNAGRGKIFLRHVESLAGDAGANRLFLAALTLNPRGRAFWEREGFSPTGLRGHSVVSDTQQELHRLVKTL